MKYLAAIFVMCCGVVYAQQNPSVTIGLARNAAASANNPGASAKSSGGKASVSDTTAASSNSSGSDELSTDDGSVAITEKPINKKKHAAEIPSSLMGGSADPAVAAKMAENESGSNASNDAAGKPASMKAVVNPAGATSANGNLHFDVLEPGSDPVSINVRSMEMYANDHTRAETEGRVRDWVKNNANVMATSPAELRRKQQYQPTKDRMLQLGFPRAWFEEAAAPAGTQ